MKILIDEEFQNRFKNKVKTNELICNLCGAHNKLAKIIDKTESHFELKESDQLYLYRPNIIDEDENYYRMKWEVDPSHEIPIDTVLRFRDYLFNHEWTSKWNGNIWEGNNCVNMSFAKFSTTKNRTGWIEFVVKHSDVMIA